MSDHQSAPPITDHVSFVSDDDPVEEAADRIHILAADDYYLTVAQGSRWPYATACFRACTSGARDSNVTALVAALWKYGKGDFAGAAACAENFIRESMLRIDACRRCSECRDAIHHFMDDLDDGGAPIWTCKHCDFVMPLRTDDPVADYAEHQRSPTPAEDRDGAELALDEIAALCGCPQWDYPAQVVRDVKAKLEALEKAIDALQTVSVRITGEIIPYIEAELAARRAKGR